MMLYDPLQIPVYHITHVDNLPGIIESNGLWCDRKRMQQNLASVNIAHEELKQRRMKVHVPLYNPKTLGDFVPFYFTNRSPMLYAIHTGFVKGYAGGQEAIIYLITTVGQLLNCGRDWCFTDGHAVEAFSDFYNKLDELSNIDWNLIEQWSWKNTSTDQDRKRRKQAEFLVEDSVPFSAFSQIIVNNDYINEKVLKICIGHKGQISVIINPDWYYN